MSLNQYILFIYIHINKIKFTHMKNSKCHIRTQHNRIVSPVILNKITFLINKTNKEINTLSVP